MSYVIVVLKKWITQFLNFVKICKLGYSCFATLLFEMKIKCLYVMFKYFGLIKTTNLFFKEGHRRQNCHLLFWQINFSISSCKINTCLFSYKYKVSKKLYSVMTNKRQLNWLWSVLDLYMCTYIVHLLVQCPLYWSNQFSLGDHDDEISSPESKSENN